MLYENFDTENTKRILFPSIKKFFDYNNTKRVNLTFYALGLSKDDNKPRNVNFSNKQFVRSLTLEFWQSPEFLNDNKLIPTEYRFKDVFTINLETSKQITKTLTKLNKTQCYSNTELLQNFVNTLKLEAVYMPINDNGDYTKNQYDIINIDEFIQNFENFEKQLLNYFNQ